MTAVTHFRAPVPPIVRTSAILWIGAVAAGAFETVLAVIGMFSDGSATAGALISGVGLRLVVFGTAIFLALRLRQGRNWARWALAVLLGVFGLLSMVVEPVQWLLAGHSIVEAVSGAHAMDLLFGGSRLAHVLAVLAAMVLMFQPKANGYFRSA
jgi:hypothetical protein